MLIIRHETDLEEIDNDRIRDLIQVRITQIEEVDFYDADIFGQFVIAQPGDTIDALERETFAPLLSEPPCFETAQDHGEVFEVAWMLAGDQAATLYVPKQAGVPDALLDYCTRYATPAVSGSEA